MWKLLFCCQKLSGNKNPVPYYVEALQEIPKIDITKKLWWDRDSENLTDVDLKFLTLYLEQNYGLSYEKRIDDVIKIVANEKSYHPVRDYLNSLVWDGTERIRYALHHFLGAEVNEYTYEVLKLFLLETISRVFYPGIKFEVMPKIKL